MLHSRPMAEELPQTEAIEPVESQVLVMPTMSRQKFLDGIAEQGGKIELLQQTYAELFMLGPRLIHPASAEELKRDQRLLRDLINLSKGLAPLLKLLPFSMDLGNGDLLERYQALKSLEKKVGEHGRRYSA